MESIFVSSFFQEFKAYLEQLEQEEAHEARQDSPTTNLISKINGTNGAGHNLQFGNIFFINVIVSLLTVICSKSSIIIYWFRFQIKISIWLIHLCAILIWNDKIWSDHTLKITIFLKSLFPCLIFSNSAVQNYDLRFSL